MITIPIKNSKNIFDGFSNKKKINILHKLVYRNEHKKLNRLLLSGVTYTMHYNSNMFPYISNPLDDNEFKFSFCLYFKDSTIKDKLTNLVKRFAQNSEELE
jgi:hypothetical protein